MANEETLKKFAEWTEKLRNGERLHSNATKHAQAVEWLKQSAQEQGIDFDVLMNSSNTSSLLAGAGQGATLGFSDEIAGAWNAITSGFEKGAYTEGRDATRARHKARQAANPNFYTGGEIGGAVGTALVPGTAAVRGGTAVGKLAGGALVGAGEGGLDAYGRQESAPGEVTVAPDLDAIRNGATWGAAGGAGGAVAGEILERSLRGFVNNKTRTAVTKEFQKIMDATGMTQAQVLQRIAAGEGPMLSQNRTFQEFTERLLANVPQSERAEFIAQIEKEAMGARSGVVDYMMRENPVPTGRGNIKAPDQDLYPNAYAADDALGGMGEETTVRAMDSLNQMARIDPRVVRMMNDNSRARYIETHRRPPQTSLIIRDPESGDFVFTRKPTAQDIDEIDRGARDTISKNKTDQRPTSISDALSAEQKAFREIIDEAYPNLASARATVAEHKAGLEAFDLGFKVSPNSRDLSEILRQYKAMTPSQQQHFRAGLATQVNGTLQNAGPNATQIGKMTTDDLRSPVYGKFLDEVFGTDKAELQRLLTRASNYQGLYNAVTGGSKTFRQTAQNAAETGAAKPPRTGVSPLGALGAGLSSLIPETGIPGMRTAAAGAGYALGATAQKGLDKAVEVGTRILRERIPRNQLTDPDLRLVIQIGLDEDPAFVQKIMQGDRTVLEKLQSYIEYVGGANVGAASGTGAGVGGGDRAPLRFTVTGDDVPPMLQPD